MPPELTDTKNLDIYGAGSMPWSRALEAIETSAMGPEVVRVLGTVRPDGRPHAASVGAIVDDGDVYFTSGPGTRKSRNLAANPNCTIFLRLEGIDLTLEGEAHRVTDAPTLDRLAARYAAIGWPAERDGDALTAPYSAQSAGPPPWHLYRLDFHTAFGVGLRDPHGASRWRFVRSP
jgi:hypothetical protein